MTTDTSTTADAGTADDDDEDDDRDKKKLIAKRQALKAEVADLRAKVKAYDDAEQARKNEEARKAQNWSVLEDDYKSQLKERDDKLAAYVAKEAAIARKERAGKFAQSVLTEAGLPAEALADVRAHLLLLQEEEGMDIAPEDGAEALAKATAKKLRKSAPTLFKQTSLGPNGAPGAQGSGEIVDAELKRAIASLNLR